MDYADIGKKYTHIGYSFPSVSEGWKPIVVRAIIDIEKAMWPRWIPLFLKRWIHYLATGNSVVRVKYRWAYKLREKLTRGQIITDIKDKYAGLRIYGYAGEEINQIIERVELECEKTCERCGSQDEVTYTQGGWIYNLCKYCKEKHEKGYREDAQ